MNQLFAVLLALLPNIIHIAGFFFFISRPIINMDYIAIPLIIMLWGGAGKRAWLIISALVLLDIFFSFAPAWHFKPASAVESVAEALNLSRTHFSLTLILLIFISLLIASIAIIPIAKLHKKTTLEWRPTLVATLLSAAVIWPLDWIASASGSAFLENKNMVGSGLNNLRIALTTHAIRPENNELAKANGASQDLFSKINLTPNSLATSIVFIVVESLGSQGLDLDREQFRHFYDLGEAMKNITVKQGLVEFNGSTVPAEMRELCGVRDYTLRPKVSHYKNRCLPELLTQKGYQTTAIHGFTGSMFSRNSWYHDLNFDRIWFAQDLVRLGIDKRCGVVFRGLCDVSIWDFISGLLHQEEGKNFYYWLTLSAHLPIPSNPDWLSDTPYTCEHESRETPSLGRCNLKNVHDHLFSRISHSIREGLMTDTTIVIVGDHAPPFMREIDRRHYSHTNVPYITIDIR